MSRLGARACSWIVIALIAGVAGPTRAGSDARSWHLDVRAPSQKGEVDRLSIGPRGELRVGPRVVEEWGPETGVLWSMITDDTGVHVGLSDPARVVRIESSNVTTRYAGSADAWVTALAAVGDGLAAGLSPDARVVFIDRQDALSEESLGDGYVWDLAVDESGDLWAAIGSPGRIVRRLRPGKWETVLETGDDPVRVIAATPDGAIVAGTARNGRVLRVTPDGAFALFDADEEEIVGIAIDPTGDVIVLAARAGRAGEPSRREQEARPEDAATDDRDAGRDDSDVSSGKTTMTVRQSTGATTVRVSAPAGPAGGTLYRISPSGDVATVWESDDDPPYALERGTDGRYWVGLGGGSRVLSVAPNGESETIVRLGSESIAAIVATPDGSTWVAASGDPRVVRLDRGPSGGSGSFVSSPFDAGWVADWGRAHWSARLAEGAAIRLGVRGGNVAEPDATWSAWSEIDVGPGQGSATLSLPPSRWAQLRVEIDAAGRRDASTTLERLEIVYLPRNRAPRILDLDVEPPGVAWSRRSANGWKGVQPLVAEDPVARRAIDEVGRRPRPAPIERGYEPGVRTIRWSAADPDGDRLRYALDVRRTDADGSWIRIASNVEEDFFGWDARGFPDGMYRVRLTADDGLDRTKADALHVERIGRAVRIDTTPPEVVDVRSVADSSGTGWIVEIRDPGGRVAALEVAHGNAGWRRVGPLDGVADHEEESFFVLEPGAGSVTIRVTDTAGNVRVASLPR